MINYILNGKVPIILLAVGLRKKVSLYIKVISQNHIPVVKKIKVEFDLSNYVTKSCLKNTTNVDTFDQHLLKRLI